jgi:signal transduction histidine kinase
MISDNGKGFDVENSEKINHYGIQNMKARAKECGAKLNINSAIGKGTTLTLVLN